MDDEFCFGKCRGQFNTSSNRTLLRSLPADTSHHNTRQSLPAVFYVDGDVGYVNIILGLIRERTRQYVCDREEVVRCVVGSFEFSWGGESVEILPEDRSFFYTY